MLYGFDPLYLILALPGILLGLFAQWRVRSAFSTYSDVGLRRGLSGAETAAVILQVKGIRNVRIEPTDGFLSDHYDPSTKTLRLSPDVFAGRSVAAAGIAAHEVGHAIQDAEGYAPLRLRSNIVPLLSFTSPLAVPLIFIGSMLAAMGTATLGTLAMQIGVALFGLVVLFQLVTLPVEFDASRRALAALEDGRIVYPDEIGGARAVLGAAALTYVAAAVSAVLQLVYFLIRTGLIGGRRED